MAVISIPAPLLDGAPVEADSAKLSDPTGTYGIKRLDSNAVVVADGENLTLVDGDTYEYDFDDAIEGVEYEAWFEITFDGETYWSNVLFDGGGGTLPTKRLAFSVIKDGELVALSPYPQLASPAGQFGVKNLDSNEVVLDSGASMGPLAGGLIFARSVQVENNETRLKFYVHTVVDGIDYYIPSTTVNVNSAMLVIGRYTNSQEIGLRFGVDNLHLWLSTPQDDKDEPIDYAMRAYGFIKRAEDMLDERIRGPFVKEPFEVNSEYEIPSTIVRLATDLAGVLMYEARGVDDVDPNDGIVQHRLRYVKQEVNATLRRIQMGLLPILGSGSSSPVQVPSAGGYCIKRPKLC